MSVENTPKGKLIVIEGGDGSGKTVQSELLVSHLKKSGKDILFSDFPRHGHPAGFFVDKMLTGGYGPIEEQEAYRTSLFYALDRFDASKEMKTHLENGGWIVSNRYLTSNIGHQGGKIKDIEKREAYVEWLFDLEYRILGIPEPDLVIYLHVPVDVSLELLKQKKERNYLAGGKKDIQEEDKNHLLDAEAAYLHCVEEFQQWEKVECFEQSILRSPDNIHLEVVEHMNKHFSEGL